ncbi:hypothetical protein OKW21_001407 [Catalinimonas alkaloidigena]|uniref:DUF937 domain-containing protein n=1 Tax=Catalinimonas alkaloidigena TaxID=1075417 RepID=UPI0024052654|nr:DUF937 domain-containing protein [Catalinimonas alkaloidigena]MDF9796144.1 hypothetical protein [Catalinimonas alkaloidigena]
MLDQIINSLKGELSKKFTGDFGMQEDKVDDAVAIAKDDIFETVKDEIGRGNIGGLMSLFQNKEQIGSNPIVTNIIKKYAGDLGSKLGLDPNLSSTIANYAIPFILGKFINTAQEKGVDQASLMSMLGGSGDGKDIGDMLKGQFGDSLGGLFK